MANSTYHEPLALIIISSISIGIAAIAALFVLVDIILRKGWKSMMAIMIPVYVVNALYLWPITLWTYLNYGRPTKPVTGQEIKSHCAHHAKPSAEEKPADEEGCHNNQAPSPAEEKPDEQGHNHHGSSDEEGTHNHHAPAEKPSDEETGGHNHHEHHHGSPERPMFATVTVAVCHCGAGCVLGDIIGEWLVYGTGATINGEMLWVEWLIDFGFAIAFGIVFQYYSIAPMTGDYGPRTLWRAAKADFLSLLFFEIGLFGWMAIFQIAIFNWQLPVNTVTYWWMMQIGMFLGHWTGVPINWYLIKKGVKEPCA